jgi:transposase
MNNSKLSRYKQKKIMKAFALELTATQAAELLGINRNTINSYYRFFRQQILSHQQKQFAQEIGEIELDESYFGGRRKGLKGRTTIQKVPVFGLLKRGGNVYIEVVPDVTARTLRTIIKKHVDGTSILYSDSYRSYDGLVLDGFEHHRINHSKEFARGRRNHINGIESFWSYAKAKLSKFYGVRRQDYPLYLKEIEFRFNLRGGNVEKALLNIIEWSAFSTIPTRGLSSAPNFIKEKE